MFVRKVPAASAISLPWLLTSAAALFDCAYSKTPSTVRSQYAAAAAAQPLSSVELAPGAETAAATNVIDGLLLLLGKLFCQLFPTLIERNSESPVPVNRMPQCQIWTSCAQPPRRAMSAALLRLVNPPKIDSFCICPHCDLHISTQPSAM